MLKSEHLEQAKKAIEKIVQDKFRTEIKSEDVVKEAIKTTLKDAIVDVDVKDKRTIYNFMSSLFLNVMINRLNELGGNAKKDSITARQIITQLVHEVEGEI